MAISEIRKYLDDLNIRDTGPLGGDIDSSKVPKTQERESILLTEPDWNDKRKGLTAKRRGLFEQFEVTPNNVCMAKEIKKLDDQIAECTEQMRLKH
jgi:hypothetical protein